MPNINLSVPMAALIAWVEQQCYPELQFEAQPF